MRYFTATFAFAVLLLGGQAFAADLPDGKALFDSNCAMCHGKDGTVSDYGKTLKPYPARNLRAAAQIVERDELRRIISFGVHGTAMTAKKYELDPLEIEAIIDYILSFRYQADLANGKRRFVQVCSTCHGVDGRAQTGLGARNLVYSKLDRLGIAHTIRYGRPGTLMTAKRHQLKNEDIADIAAFVYNLRFRGKPEVGAKLYAANCRSCHAKPADIRLIGNIARPEQSIRDVDDHMLGLRIRHGRHIDRAGERVAKLGADDVQHIVAYLRAEVK